MTDFLGLMQVRWLYNARHTSPWLNELPIINLDQSITRHGSHIPSETWLQAKTIVHRYRYTTCYGFTFDTGDYQREAHSFSIPAAAMKATPCSSLTSKHLSRNTTKSIASPPPHSKIGNMPKSWHSLALSELKSEPVRRLVYVMRSSVCSGRRCVSRRH